MGHSPARDDDAAAWCETLLHELRGAGLAAIEEDLGVDRAAEGDFTNQDGEHWGLWGGMIPAHDATHASIAITCEHSHYAIDDEGEDVPASDDLLLEVGVVLPIPEGRQLPAALARVRTALEVCVPAAASETYPNQAPLLPGVYLYHPKTPDTLERGVWISARSRVLGTTWSAALLPSAVDALVTMMPTLRHAVGVAQGAIHGSAASLNLQVVQGWMAEYRVWLERRHQGVTFGPDWRAPYDLERGHERFEVKSTCSDSPSLIHLSPAEVELALGRKQACSLLRVKVEVEARDAVFAALRDASSTGPTAPLPEPAARLAQATGLAACEVLAAWPAIEAECRPDRDWAVIVREDRDPLGWLDAVRGALTGLGAGLTLPFDCPLPPPRQ